MVRAWIICGERRGISVAVHREGEVREVCHDPRGAESCEDRSSAAVRVVDEEVVDAERSVIADEVRQQPPCWDAEERPRAQHLACKSGFCRNANINNKAFMSNYSTQY